VVDLKKMNKILEVNDKSLLGQGSGWN